MSHAETKWERLDEMERLLADRRWTMAELGEHLGVTRQSADNYRKALEGRRPIETDEKGHYWIDRTTYVSHITLNLDEALVLYLAARRQQRLTWFGRRAVAGALSKLAGTLGKPMMERMVNAANKVLEQDKSSSEQETILAAVLKAWANRQVLHLHYRGLKGARAYEDRFRVYLIEPAPWGDATYILGHSEKLGDAVLYKIDRITRASVSGETFEIPEHFDEQKLFEQAWGVWVGAGEPERIRLRFTPGDASKRLRESAWHSSARRLELPDGGCELTLEVSEVTEVIPWIRSWGPQVEVLEPKSLRDKMQGEARRLAEIYGAESGRIDTSDIFEDFFGG